MRSNLRLVAIVAILHVVFFDLDSAKKGRRRSKKESHNGQVDITSFIDHDTLNCPCDRIHCEIKNPKNLRCEGGTTTDVCGCCPVCAKLNGQPCGGTHNYLGKCDKGLICDEDHSSPHLTPKIFPTNTILDEHSRPASDQRKGKCIVVAEMTIETDPDLTCKSECTTDFCLSNPKAICSARNNAMESQDCQGECQHTACSACFFQEDPQCPKCHNNDFTCIKKFAKCARKKSTCTRNKYPCKKLKKPPTGKFVCWVPKCL